MKEWIAYSKQRENGHTGLIVWWVSLHTIKERIGSQSDVRHTGNRNDPREFLCFAFEEDLDVYLDLVVDRVDAEDDPLLGLIHRDVAAEESAAGLGW